MSEAMIKQSTWDATPILDAVENYRGTIIDVDAQIIVSADEFATARNHLISLLKQQGLKPGDRVLIAIGNSPLFIAVLTAILACEASPLFVHVKTPAAELSRYANRFGVKFLATQGNSYEILNSFLIASTRLEAGIGGSLIWGEMNRESDDVPGPKLLGVPLHPTSGSTGLPKIALRPGYSAIEEARHYRDTMAIYEDDCILAIPPMSHAYGYGVCVMLPLLTGASIVTTANFNMKLLASILHEHPVSVLPCVPAHLDMMHFGCPQDFGQLRWILTAGSMMPRRSAEQFRKRTGITVCPLYGTTETGGISVATAASGLDVDGRVGPAMDGVEVRVKLSTESQNGITPGVGKIHVRSPSMMAGYLDDEGNITSPCEDGWFETGDLALIAKDNTIHLRGRTGEMINVLGLKVVPCEVEETMAQIPGIKEVKVYGRRLGSQSEVVKAAVATEQGIEETAIRAYCEENLVYYKRPSVITMIDALPRTAAGKIATDQLP